jgi:hypothetical protein
MWTIEPSRAIGFGLGAAVVNKLTPNPVFLPLALAAETRYED